MTEFGQDNLAPIARLPAIDFRTVEELKVALETQKAKLNSNMIQYEQRKWMLVLSSCVCLFPSFDLLCPDRKVGKSYSRKEENVQKGSRMHEYAFSF